MAYIYLSGFSVSGPIMQWDGTNDAEVITWINGESGNDVPDNTWSVDSVTATELIISAPSKDPVTIGLNNVLSVRAPRPPATGRLPFPGEIPPSHWIAADETGRASSLNQVFLPEA